MVKLSKGFSSERAIMVRYEHQNGDNRQFLLIFNVTVIYMGDTNYFSIGARDILLNFVLSSEKKGY